MDRGSSPAWGTPRQDGQVVVALAQSPFTKEKYRNQKKRGERKRTAAKNN